ncbi:unnamed protein product [Darwinula stevensoni]|uniref:Kringle domain-containing protein n=1 Tax=Darwinula stevensoni TaxID=69355 RepID=A0A7R8XG01_9CRUS|nr:unnamed protein product [Darwinula stevensoni]CAG0895839.1 unnamed protein product [Darwinula stevensoni]
MADPPECKLTERGAEYVGKQNVTMSGVPCLPWLMIPSSFLYNGLILRIPDEVDGRHGFCRNPEVRDYGPYCYTSLEGEWGYCDVPFCPTPDREKCDVRVGGQCVSPLECKTDLKGKAYIGTKNVTHKGHKCLPWMLATSLTREDPFYGLQTYEISEAYSVIITDAVTLNAYTILDDMHPGHNFCRNPTEDENGPWCFKSSGKGRDFCDIPTCP